MSDKSMRDEEFLDVEDSARQLAEALRQLGASVEGYREASKEIGGVTQATARLAEGIEQVGARSAEALDVLIAMGGPQIANRLDALADRLAAIESRLVESADLSRANGAAIAQMERDTEQRDQALQRAQARVLTAAVVASIASAAALIAVLLR